MSAEGTPPVADIPMLMRRRLSRLGRMALRSAIDANGDGMPHLVFTSRHGECGQTLIQLQRLAEATPLSPARFGMSVHNALAGMFSMLTGNTAPHTAIAAGAQSFEHGLLESVLLVAEDAARQVLLVHYDEPIPEFYEMPDPGQPAMALALLIGSQAGDPMVLGHGPDAPAQGDSALAFVRFLTGAQTRWSGMIGQQGWKCESDAG